MLASTIVIVITTVGIVVVTYEYGIRTRLVFQSKVCNDSGRNMQGRILRDDDSV